MLDALETLKKQYQIDQVLVVADSAMIDQSNQEFILQTPGLDYICLLYTSPSPRDRQKSRMPSSA